MPVKKTGKNSYRYGSSGKKYVGKNAKKKAAKQGRAIKSSQSKMSKY